MPKNNIKKKKVYIFIPLRLMFLNVKNDKTVPQNGKECNALSRVF